jgi:hypothetical protein
MTEKVAPVQIKPDTLYITGPSPPPGRPSNAASPSAQPQLNQMK